MTKRKAADSPLVIAATAFDEQLAEYTRLAELLLRTPLTTVRQVERANQIIGEIAATEEQLGATGRTLAQAIGDAHRQQQQLAEQMVAHLPSVQTRNQALHDILTQLQELGEAIREINSAATGGAAVLDLEERVGALAERAAALATHARTAGFDEPATQAHALHQQMLAVARKLHDFTSRQS